MKLTKNFNSIEFDCKDGTPVPESLMANIKKLAENLQVLRDEVGEPIHIISGYRTAKHNKSINGASGSLHLKAMAGDIMCKQTPPRKLQSIIERLIKKGKMQQGGLGKYNTFTHYDVRDYKARW